MQNRTSALWTTFVCAQRLIFLFCWYSKAHMHTNLLFSRANKIWQGTPREAGYCAAEGEGLAKWLGKNYVALPTGHQFCADRRKKRKERPVARPSVLLQQEATAQVMTNMTWCGKQLAHSTLTPISTSHEQCHRLQPATICLNFGHQTLIWVNLI